MSYTNLLTKNTLNNYKFLFSLFSTAILFIVTITTCWLRFNTNDDSTFSLLSKGVILNNTPSEYLLFIHFYVGLFLKKLYQLWPSIPWYGINLYVLLFLSFTFIGYSLLRLHTPVIIWLLWLSIFGTASIVISQFTIVALFLGGSGFILFFSLLLAPPSNRRTFVICYIIALLLIMFSGFIRFHAMLLSTSIFIVLLFMSMLLQKHISKLHIVSILGVVACSLMLEQVNTAHYKHSEGYENFTQYNNARIQFTDRMDVFFTPQNAYHFKKVGWTQNDYDMLMAWFYFDKTVYSQQHLNYLAQNAYNGFDIHKKIIAAKSYISDNIFFYSFCFLIFTLVVTSLMPPLRWRDIILLDGILIAYPISIWLLLTIIEHSPPYRVWMPILGITALIPLLFYPLRTLTFKGKLHYNIIVALLLFGLNSLYLTTASNTNKDNYASVLKDMALLAPRSDQLFISWSVAFPIQDFVHPLKNPHYSKDFKLIFGGSAQQEGHSQRRLQEFHIDDIYQALYKRNDVFLISFPDDLPLMHIYLKEHYNVTTWHRVYFKGENFTVYQIIKI